ncbi:MAG: agmatine deiminase family protein [Bacteroidales bacterium]|nr:agmatine deiminase family protein [Bacteroidales bacterium]
MKKLMILALAVLVGAAAMAQAPKGFDRQQLNRLKSRDEMRKASWQRKAPEVDFSKMVFDGPAKELPAPKGAKAAGDTVWASQMPENRWFPGEWEEVQAIVVTFPHVCYPAGHVGDDNYYASISLPGYGMCKHYNEQTNRWVDDGWGAVDGVPDTTDYQSLVDYYSQYLTHPFYATMAREYMAYYQDQIAFRNVFVNLIDAIQHGAQVWIVVWNLKDSTVIKDFMAAQGKPMSNYRFIENYTNAFWYRDCGPICFYYGDSDSVAMLNFEYGKRACDDLLPDSISSQTGIPNYTTSIEWEGGNCLVDGTGMLFTSEAIYSENADTKGQLYYTGNPNNPVDYRYKTPLSQAAVKDSMERMIGTTVTYILPRLRFDGGTGHVDLYMDMIDENQFVFSKYPTQYSDWTDYAIAGSNIDSLTSWQSYFGENFRCAYIPFPSKDDGSYFASENEYNGIGGELGYTRSYSNHTFVNNIIIQPCFSEVVDGEPSAAWDRANFDSLRAAYPGYTFYPIDIRSFDGFGGAIHCITKQIPAEHPIRILHLPLHGNTGMSYTSNGAPILARITNVDGIDTAQVFYRIEGGMWQSVPMMSDAIHQYAAVIPTSGHLHGESTKVDYYISATSNAGKTITKPMTASQGGYYTFYLGGTSGEGIQTVAAEERFGQFYPNPSVEAAHLQVSLGEGAGYSVLIVDAAGRTVHTGRLQASGNGIYTVNTALLPTGMYSVVFQNDSERVVRRLVVK